MYTSLTLGRNMYKCLAVIEVYIVILCGTRYWEGEGEVIVMVFNATFYNISVILWWSVLLVEETGEYRENHRPTTSH